MTAGEIDDAVAACKKSMECYKEEPVIVNLGGTKEADELLMQLPGMQQAQICHMEFFKMPEFVMDGIYGEVPFEKQEWKNLMKDEVKKILKQKPEAVYVEGDVFSTYPIVHLLRKKHVRVFTMAEQEGKKIIVRIPSGS